MCCARNGTKLGFKSDDETKLENVFAVRFLTVIDSFEIKRLETEIKDLGGTIATVANAAATPDAAAAKTTSVPAVAATNESSAAIASAATGSQTSDNASAATAEAHGGGQIDAATTPKEGGGEGGVSVITLGPAIGAALVILTLFMARRRKMKRSLPFRK